MIRQILLGGATAVLVTGSASALTMSVNGDNRSVTAYAQAGGDVDSNSGPAPAGSTYDEQVSASAAANNIPTIVSGGSGGGAGGFFGAVANASAGQFSEIGALSISGSGHADASGNHGDNTDILASDADGAGGGGGLFFGDFRSDSSSILEVLFSIDEAAEYDLSGFLFAGDEIAIGGEGSDINNIASIILIDTDSSESVYKAEVSNDSTSLDEQGVLDAGNYRFTVHVEAAVNGISNRLISSIDGGPTNGFGYATSAGFKGVSLELSAIDKPIPEPVTTTLAAMGLGALVLRTSRRRHS